MSTIEFHLEELDLQQLQLGAMSINFSSNITHFDLSNFSEDDFNRILKEYKEQFTNRELFTPVFKATLIAVYLILGVISLLGNLTMIYVISNNPGLRTARNLYIANLSVSDLTLCVICMPFTLITLIRWDWPYGRVLCKMVPTFQATNVFVSTFSFSAIALDRYNVIVTSSSKTSSTSRGNILKISITWALGFLLSVPWILYTDVVTPGADDLGIIMYEKCVETFPPNTVIKTVAVIGVMVIQYLLPVITVSIAHARITAFLKYHRRTMCANINSQSAAKQEKERRRTNRTAHVLVAITVIFAISWLPLNIYNLIADFKPQLLSLTAVNGNLPFAVCHAIAMSSACWNPLLYGWLNNSIRNEIGSLFSRMWSHFCCKSRQEEGSLRINTTVTRDGCTYSAVNLHKNGNREPTATGRTELTTLGNHLGVPVSASPVLPHNSELSTHLDMNDCDKKSTV